MYKTIIPLKYNFYQYLLLINVYIFYDINKYCNQNDSLTFVRF